MAASRSRCSCRKRSSSNLSSLSSSLVMPYPLRSELLPLEYRTVSPSRKPHGAAGWKETKITRSTLCRLHDRLPFVADRETKLMSVQSHLEELQRRHAALQTAIERELHHAATDPLRVAELKRRKLLLKDQITRLRGEATVH
ncbi:YdcH family protein [Xanthobacter sp. DSM 24535]|uniref:YdcH family protein n=1 Tax=Roseixanthobacter psychrophilus TaxID=3119917 RepID=UPI00372AE34E